MKFLTLLITLIISISCYSSNELIINNQSLRIILSDDNEARITSCSEFIALRKVGEKVKNLPDLSQTDYDLAKSELFKCYINAYAIEHQLQVRRTHQPALNEILHHLPATEKLIASNEEKIYIENNFKGKSIWDTSPDLIPQDDIFLSKQDDTGYRIMDYKSYRSPNNADIDLITLAAFALHGTYGVRSNYIVTSKKNNIWIYSKVDENSQL